MRSTLTIVLVLFTAVFSVSAQCSDAAKKELKAFDLTWSTAGQTGDKAGLTVIFADDYVGFPGMIGKAAAIENTMKTFEENKANPAKADKVTYDNYIISCTPNTATITHRNTVWTPDGEGGKPETFYTRSVHFLEKRNGKWVVVSNAGNNLDDYATIWYLEQDWNDAVLKKDRAWFEKNYASDFSSVDAVTGSLANKAEDIAGAVSDKLSFDNVETTNMVVRVEGDKAVVTGIFHTKGKDDKGPFDRKMRYTDTWIKRDGRWQAWASQGTIIK